MIVSNPPLLQDYEALLNHTAKGLKTLRNQNDALLEECDLPLIDLNDLTSHDKNERLACSRAICNASSDWGFFQVVNHGISPELLKNMRAEQVKLFQSPFDKKADFGLLNLSYRWGTPTATSPSQFSWTEVFHIPLTKVAEASFNGEICTLRELMKDLAAAMSQLARLLAGVLADNLGHQRCAFQSTCDEGTCFLRLNHYPACPMSQEVYGLVPHTDSDFLTILSQDQVGGLQLMKDSKWVAVKPNEDALIVNIGDLFQAWSNDAYKSVEHRVMTKKEMERFSIAFFLCPSYDALIGSCSEPSIYKKFTFGEYRRQVQEDVRRAGHKTGLSRFLVKIE